MLALNFSIPASGRRSKKKIHRPICHSKMNDERAETATCTSADAVRPIASLDMLKIVIGLSAQINGDLVYMMMYEKDDIQNGGNP